MSSDWKTLPNAITLIRLALIPVFLALELGERHLWALIAFAFALGSDWLDGLLARLLRQRSHLGGVLDPVADKLLVFTALVGLVWQRALPVWILGLVIARDALMLFGAAVVAHKRLDLPTQPSRIGKYATFALGITVLGALANEVVQSPRVRAYTAVACFFAGLCVAISTVQYLSRFGYLFFAPSQRSSSHKPQKW